MAQLTLLRHAPSPPFAIRLLLLPATLLVAVALATMTGPVAIPPGEIVHILLHQIGLWPAVTWPRQDQDIIWLIRVPRVIAAVAVGAALAVAGSLFQAVLRNPLADPYVIGTSAGAGTGVAIALLLSLQFAVWGFGAIQILAFAGALVTVLFVYALARTQGRTPVVTLLLAGFVTSSFLISATSLLMVAGNRETQVIMWTMGSMDVSEFTQLTVTGPLILLGTAAAVVLAHRLDVLVLGEEQAAHLGIRVERLKLMAIVLASLLTAMAVSLAGIVAFVGLVIPHSARLIYGPQNRVLIPTAALGGALFVVVADLLAHLVLAPTVVPLGAVTAVVGAPFFLHLLRRGRHDYTL